MGELGKVEGESCGCIQLERSNDALRQSFKVAGVERNGRILLVLKRTVYVLYHMYIDEMRIKAPLP